MSDSSSSAHIYEDSREESSSPSPPGTPRHRARSLPGDSNNESVDWPLSPARSTSSSQLSAEAALFSPRKAASDGGHNDLPNEHRPVPSHDHPKIRLPSGRAGTVTFTSDHDIIRTAASANIAVHSKDITFLEHKCNGKSKGTAFINCHSPESMMRLLKWFETHEFQGKKVTASVSSNVNGRPPIPPPTHNKDNGQGHFPNRGEDTHTRAPLPFPPTNAHGGVNFNRVPLHHRQQVQQMQQAGFLNHSNHTNNATKPTRAAVPVPYSHIQSYGDVTRKKKVAPVHPAPVVYAPNDPAIVWQQTSADYARALTHSRNIRI